MVKKILRNRSNLVNRLLFCFGLLLVLIGGSTSPVWAAENPYPNRPINMVVPASPGGASDIGSKIMANKIGEFLGQPLISIYKPGGGTALGASYVAKAKPDGYTVLSFLSLMMLPPEVQKTDYTLDDFIQIGMWARAPYFLMVKADSKWKNFKEFIEDAKKAPGKLSMGMFGARSSSFLSIASLPSTLELSLLLYPSNLVAT